MMNDSVISRKVMSRSPNFLGPLAGCCSCCCVHNQHHQNQPASGLQLSKEVGAQRVQEDEEPTVVVALQPSPQQHRRLTGTLRLRNSSRFTVNDDGPMMGAGRPRCCRMLGGWWRTVR